MTHASEGETDEDKAYGSGRESPEEGQSGSIGIKGEEKDKDSTPSEDGSKNSKKRCLSSPCEPDLLVRFADILRAADHFSIRSSPESLSDAEGGPMMFVVLRQLNQTVDFLFTINVWRVDEVFLNRGVNLSELDHSGFASGGIVFPQGNHSEVE